MLKRHRKKYPLICCFWLNYEAAHFLLFTSATIIFPRVNDSLWRTVSLYLPKEKMWSEYQNAIDTCRDIGLLFIVDISTLRWNRGRFQIADPQAKLHGIIKKHTLPALSAAGTDLHLSPCTLLWMFWSGFIVWSQEGNSPVPCHRHHTDAAGRGKSERKLGLRRMAMPGKNLSLHLYKKWGRVVRLRDYPDLSGLDSRILCWPAIRRWASYLVALCLSFLETGERYTSYWACGVGT